MCVGLTWSAAADATGLPLKNGSMSTTVWPWLSSKHAWPRNRMSMSALLRQRFSQLPPHRDTHHHAYTRLLGEQRPHCGDARVGVRGGRRFQDLPVVRLAKPAALVECVDQDPLKLRGQPSDL